MSTAKGTAAYWLSNLAVNRRMTKKGYHLYQINSDDPSNEHLDARRRHHRHLSRRKALYFLKSRNGIKPAHLPKRVTKWQASRHGSPLLYLYLAMAMSRCRIIPADGSTAKLDAKT
ncbi:hypothetical protein WP1_101 [Pseudomonas phage WP1]